MTLRESIVAAQATAAVPFDSAAIGQRVYIRVLTGQEVSGYWVFISGKAAGVVQQTLVQRCLANEDGTPVFSPTEMGEVGKLNNRFLEEVAGEAQRVNCLTTADVKQMRADFFAKRVTSGSSSSPVISESATPTS
jgi:hypothetical protein